MVECYNCHDEPAWKIKLRQLYINLSTSIAEELAARWLPFTFISLNWGIWNLRTIWGAYVFGVLFGAFHVYSYWKNPTLKMLAKVFGLMIGGVILNTIYIARIPEGWNLLFVIAIHFIARLIGRKWGL